MLEDNPIRNFGDERSEQGALDAVRAALGGVYARRTGQDPTKSDGLIRLTDESEIDLEVFRNVISEFRQATSELERIKNPVKLTPGNGRWIALLPADAPFKEFSKLGDDVFQKAVANASTESNGRSPIIESGQRWSPMVNGNPL